MAAISGFGTTITVGAANIGEVLSLSADGMKLSTIDVTNITQRHRVFVPGIIDSGTIGVEVNYDDTPGTGQVNMIKQMDATASSTAPTAQAIVFTCGSATNKGFTLSGNAIVTDFSTKIGIDAAVTASFNLKWTGAVTFADVA
jgi:hypothetical protein